MKSSIKRNPFALFEASRALSEMGALAFFLPLLDQLPKGDGHGVFVIPGFGASDRSTYFLRNFLKAKGYQTSGWELGKNLGLDNVQGMNSLLDSFLDFQQPLNAPVSIIGWSLGGVHGRRIAKRLPALTRQVICLGSPIHAFPDHNQGWQVYEKVNGRVMNNETVAGLTDISLPPSIPCTSIYSKSDGVVPWQIAKEMDSEHTDNIEVCGSHIGLGVNPAVFYLISDRLAQPAKQWQQFDETKLRHRLALGVLDPVGRLLQSDLMIKKA